MTESRTTVAISGGGPAGIMLGLLLARRGIEVTVLEQHADFLRDFRGDTVHPMTQAVLADLGLTEEFDRLAKGRMDAVEVATPEGVLVHEDLADVAPAGARFADVAIAAQWDLLDLLARTARDQPSFRLVMEAETVGVLKDRVAVRGLRYRRHGEEHRLRAILTVAADGRRSRLRREFGSDPVALGAPLDVLWFRVDREEGEPADLRGAVGRGGTVIAIDRGDSWQIAFLVPKGSEEAIRGAGLPAFRQRVAAVAPWLRERLETVTDWDAVKPLSVSVERLRRWSAPGVLAIGDAAHTMSPVGGVGVGLAIADAVATANLLADDLLRAQADPHRWRRVLNPAILDRVQRRRERPVLLTQRVQVLVQNRLTALMAAPRTPPEPVKALIRGPLGRLLPRLFMYGIRPERVRT